MPTTSPSAQRDVGRIDLAGEEIDELRVGEQQLRRLFAGGESDRPLQTFDLLHGPALLPRAV